MNEPTCRTCKARMRTPPLPRDTYNPLLLSRAQIMWLENAARYFDRESDEPWTAETFIAWLKPDLTGKYPPIPEFAGTSLKEGTTRNGAFTRHGSADPLPVVPMKLRRMVG